MIRLTSLVLVLMFSGCVSRREVMEREYRRGYEACRGDARAADAAEAERVNGLIERLKKFNQVDDGGNLRNSSGAESWQK